MVIIINKKGKVVFGHIIAIIFLINISFQSNACTITPPLIWKDSFSIKHLFYISANDTIYSKIATSSLSNNVRTVMHRGSFFSLQNAKLNYQINFDSANNSIGERDSDDDDLIRKNRSKIVITYLPLIIMARLSETGLISPVTLISYIEETFQVRLSSGTVYPIFKGLENSGYITKLQNKTNRLFVLTTKGRQSFEYLKANYVLINSSLKIK